MFMNLSELFELYQKERLPSLSTIQKYNTLLRVFTRDTGCNNIYITHEQILN